MGTGNGRKPLRERLREIRRAAGLSQLALAEEAGLSQHCVAWTEIGREDPRLSTLESIAGALGYEVALRRPPMRPERTGGGGIRAAKEYACPACGLPLDSPGIYRYCRGCGQEIDWTKEETGGG